MAGMGFCLHWKPVSGSADVYIKKLVHYYCLLSKHIPDGNMIAVNQDSADNKSNLVLELP